VPIYFFSQGPLIAPDKSCERTRCPHSKKDIQEELMNTPQNQITKEVLFQKLGKTWYIFTEVNEKVIYSAMPEGMDPRSTKLELYDVIEDHLKKVAEQPRFKAERSA